MPFENAGETDGAEKKTRTHDDVSLPSAPQVELQELIRLG